MSRRLFLVRTFFTGYRGRGSKDRSQNHETSISYEFSMQRPRSRTKKYRAHTRSHRHRWILEMISSRLSRRVAYVCTYSRSVCLFVCLFVCWVIYFKVASILAAYLRYTRLKDCSVLNMSNIFYCLWFCSID